ncbi:MAG: tRNA (adenosine(37)-N6)-threonylcarbamoyltransferase complex dimerization subunit type 1 TsaB [bacterium]
MRLLALDTSGASQSVALLEDERCLHESFDPQPVSHSETLLRSVDAALQTVSWRLGDLDLFAVSAGPGSFTGLRIGMSTLKGLSLATGKPAVGVSALQALALPRLVPELWVVPCLDARCGEVYAGAYRGSPEDIKIGLEDRAWPIEVFLQHLAELPGDKLVLGNALVAYRERFSGLAQTGEEQESVRASSVGRLALRAFRAGGAGILQPRYLRASEAENRLARKPGP